MIHLTDAAKLEVKKLIESKSDPHSFLRIGVKGGGCSGMSYDVRFDTIQTTFDRPFEVDGISIVTDVKSLLYLDNMTIDYSTELVNGGFRFINPNAKGSCGCGTSFSA